MSKELVLEEEVLADEDYSSEEVRDEDSSSGVDGRDLLRQEMEQAVSGNTAIGQEFQATFTEEERISSILNLRSDSYTLELGRINLLELSPTVPLKESRKQTYKG